MVCKCHVAIKNIGLLYRREQLIEVIRVHLHLSRKKLFPLYQVDQITRQRKIPFYERSPPLGWVVFSICEMHNKDAVRFKMGQKIFENSLPSLYRNVLKNEVG